MHNFLSNYWTVLHVMFPVLAVVTLMIIVVVLWETRDRLASWEKVSESPEIKCVCGNSNEKIYMHAEWCILWDESRAAPSGKSVIYPKD